MNLATDFLEMMDRGGPVMWIIFVTAWIAIIMLTERSLRIHRWGKNASLHHSQIEETGTLDPALNHSPISLLLQRLATQNISNKDELAEHMNIQLTEIMPKLEGTLPTIAVIGSLLPMLGLLGTVTGMIEVFQVIALHGTGDPQEMAGGISQALLTTASGLIIAIPVIFAHHILVRKLRNVLATTEQSMHQIYIRFESSSL